MEKYLNATVPVLLLVSGLGSPAQPLPEDRAIRHHHYTLIDIGTAAGAGGNGLVTEGFAGFTRPINERGVATSCANSSVLDPNFSSQNPYFSNEHVQVAYVWE